MKSTWALVADEAIARVLTQPPEGGDLVLVEELSDPDAHTREADMHHGPHGRRTAAVGGSSQAAVPAGESERHQHAQLFARRIAQRLRELRHDQGLEQLHLFVAPRLRGYLRPALHAEVSEVIVSSTDKELTHETLAEITRRVFGAPREPREPREPR